VHQMNSARYVGDSKMHEMVACAMEENWDVCRAHMEFITGQMANVIASGVASGEFHVRDAATAALCTCTAMIRFFHPQLIAESANKPGPTLDQMIDFVIAGLGGPDLAQ
jgi:Tetracyclin repressor-like, C-terminal domain